MEAVNFREHPEQLYGIFTTTENIPNVRTWLENANLNPDLAYTFQGFLEQLNKENEKHNSHERFVESVKPTDMPLQAIESAGTDHTVADKEIEL